MTTAPAFPAESPARPDRKQIRARLQIPSEYYLSRGYSREILDRFDVGECFDKTKPFYRRAVFPVYDASGKIVVGSTARSIDPQCEHCGLYHPERKPCWFATPDNKIIPMDYLKWRHSDELPRDSLLYGWWLARPFIEKSWKVILCESPGNVLRFHEAGYNHAVGLFGTRATDRQQILLEMASVMEVIVALDNDDAGREGEKEIKKKFGRLFRLHFVHLPPEHNDWGELAPGRLTELYEDSLKKGRKRER